MNNIVSGLCELIKVIEPLFCSNIYLKLYISYLSPIIWNIRSNTVSIYSLIKVYTHWSKYILTEQSNQWTKYSMNKVYIYIFTHWTEYPLNRKLTEQSISSLISEYILWSKYILTVFDLIFLTCVCSLVFYWKSFLSKRFVTLVTLMWFFPCV